MVRLLDDSLGIGRHTVGFVRPSVSQPPNVMNFEEWLT